MPIERVTLRENERERKIIRAGRRRSRRGTGRGIALCLHLNELLNDRDEEGQGLATPGLGLHQDVPASEDHRDRPPLDISRVLHPQILLEGVTQNAVDSQVRKAGVEGGRVTGSDIPKAATEARLVNLDPLNSRIQRRQPADVDLLIGSLVIFTLKNETQEGKGGEEEEEKKR